MATPQHPHNSGRLNTHTTGLLAEERPVRMCRINDLAARLRAKGSVDDAALVTRLAAELGRLRWIRACAWNEKERPPKTSDAEDHDSGDQDRMRKPAARAQQQVAA